MRSCCRALALGGLVLWAGPVFAQDNPDSVQVVAVIAGFHAALAGGDSAAAMELLAPDAAVLESGAVESRAEYQSHHLAADIGFASAMASERTVLSVVVADSAAWVVSSSVTTGKFRGRDINSSGAELMVLTAWDGGWRIRAIHWSSRARR